MQDMGWTVKAAVLTLAFLSLSSVAYIFYRKKNDEDDFLSIESSKSRIIEFKVPKKSMGLILGRNGSTIKEIQSKSGCKIHFAKSHDSEEYKICLIRGTPESIELAEFLIHEVIVNQPLIENYEMYVPKEACGRIIGKNGENIRYITRTANVKIVVENINSVKDKDISERKLTITGTAEQICFAKLLIDQKVEEEIEYRNRIQCRLPRNRARYMLPNFEETEMKDPFEHKEKLVATGSDGLLEVYVSAVKDPEQFWVQIMGSSTVELDRLNEQMTEYYSNEDNRKLHELKEMIPGQIVAAFFSFDKKWYRAEVVSCDDYDVKESEVKLCFVDYGDLEYFKKEDIYELRTDFQRLRFQAIECILAKIKPRDTWSPAAINLFEDLTHSTMWKAITARVHEYRERPANGKRSGIPVPCVELYDSYDTKTINVAEELVKMGFAEWDVEEKAAAPQCPETEIQEDSEVVKNRTRIRKSEAEKWD